MVEVAAEIGPTRSTRPGVILRTQTRVILGMITGAKESRLGTIGKMLREICGVPEMMLGMLDKIMKAKNGGPEMMPMDTSVPKKIIMSLNNLKQKYHAHVQFETTTYCLLQTLSRGLALLVIGLALLLDLIFTRPHIPEIGFEKGIWTIYSFTGSWTSPTPL
jgi:hypothetical protein